jgi:hypothetical protein
MKTGYKIAFTADRTPMSEYSGRLISSLFEKTMLRTLLNIGVFLLLRKILACESNFRAGRSFKLGKNTFQISNPSKLTSVIRI